LANDGAALTIDAELDPEALPSEDELQQRTALKSGILAKLAASLETSRDEAIRWRAPIEQRWIDDLRQKHNGQPSLPEAKADNAVGRGGADEFRYTRDNITRPACIQIAARLSDMLFPTSEKNWALEPSPLPDLSNPDEVITDPMTGEPYTVPGADGNPRPMTASDIAARVKKLADQKCSRMSQAIDDALQECHYNTQGRAMIGDAVDLGTGVIKGPVVRRTRHTSYQQFDMPDGTKVPSLKVKDDEKPGLYHVDLWNFFPQPCRKIEEAEYTNELHLLTAKKVRDLVNQPGFDKDQINDLLKQEPDLGELQRGGALVERDRILAPQIETMRGRYAIWEYHGPIPREALEVMGMEFDEDDKLTVVDGEVWYSQGIVIKVNLNPDEYADRVPYYLFNYEKDPSCCFGFSVPYVLRSDQYAVNQTWHAVMLNALMSAGAQIGVIPGMMEPHNGRVDLSCTKPKTWAMKSEVMDISKVLSVWTIPNVTGPLMSVYETARRNAADHTLLPQFMEGEPTKAAQTMGGLAMLMNSANVVQRDGAKNYDGDVTVPGLTAMNRWFLLHGDDQEAKGDFNVMPKGESHLLVKDIQTQHVQVLTQIAENPRYAPYFDTWELLQLNVKTLSVPVTGLLRDRETVEQEMKAQAEQPDPMMAKAEADKMLAEASMLRAQTEAQRATNEHEQFQMAMRDKADERLLRLTFKEADIDLQANKQVSDEDIERAKLQVMETKVGIDGRLEAEKIVARERETALEVQVESPHPRLA
jgi:hypothetical protein